ncbi:helix-turn-helix domain-containing protein [Kitasatospora sp. NPDC008050]|uniref:helix-turn-helix domain-containing protein n=1 Tax=Kitasatospora sp. NPDC008050 TaxID=3364021 RepID=UPI0036E590C9
MTTPKDWQAAVTGRVAEAVRRFREERGMSAQDVADACAKLGYPIARSVIANLENGRRSSVDVAELLVLAKVLDVPPVALLVPVGEESEIEVLPDQVYSTDDALMWVTGELPLDYEPPDDTVEERFEEVRKHSQMVYALLKSISRTDEHRRGAALTRDQATREFNLDLVARFDDIIGDQTLGLQEFRAQMREKGIRTPSLPPPLTHLDLVETDEGWVHVSQAPDAPGARPASPEELEALMKTRPLKRLGER